MAALSNIIDHIKKESEQNVNAIISDAEKYANKLMDDAKKNADNEVSTINKKCEAELKSIAERSVSSSELKKKQIELESKHAIIVETIEMAKQKLINLPDAEYIDFIKKVFAKNIPTKDCKIVFNSKDLKRIPKNVIDELVSMSKQKGANVTVASEDAKIQSGFILDFGDTIGNCSFESLIDQNIDNLVDKVNKILFS